MHGEDGRDGARQRARDDTRTCRQIKRNKCTKITTFHFDWNLSVDHCINLWWSCNPVYSKSSSLSARCPAPPPFFHYCESKTKSIRSNCFCLPKLCQTIFIYQLNHVKRKMWDMHKAWSESPVTGKLVSNTVEFNATARLVEFMTPIFTTVKCSGRKLVVRTGMFFGKSLPNIIPDGEQFFRNVMWLN